MPKTPRSFSIDEDVDELLSDRDDINASGLVNQFLRDYIAGGKGKEAALELRLDALDEEISELEQELRQKERERDRIESQLDDLRSTTNEAVSEFVGMIANDEFDPANLTEDNIAVQNYASDAGLPADVFVEKVEARL